MLHSDQYHRPPSNQIFAYQAQRLGLAIISVDKIIDSHQVVSVR